MSATRIDGDGSDNHCLIVHGTAHRVSSGHPLHAGYSRYALALYGLPIPPDLDDPDKPRQPDEDSTGYIEPRRIYAHGFA